MAATDLGVSGLASTGARSGMPNTNLVGREPLPSGGDSDLANEAMQKCECSKG